MPTVRFTTIDKAGQRYRVPADRNFYINYLIQSPFHARIATLADRVEKLIRERGATTRFDREEFYEAAGLCVYAHKDAIREVSGKPYADHPITLVEREVDLFYVTDIEELCAGLPHDVPEDTHYDIDFIRRRFGRAVANLVDGLTKIKRMEKEKDRLISEENIDKFVGALTKDIRLLRLKMSDRGINLEDIEKRGEESRLRNCQEALDFYVPLGILCGFMKAARHLSDIAFKKLYPERHQAIEEIIARTVAENQSLLEELKSKTEKEYRRLNKTGEIEILTKPRTVYEVDQIATMRGTEARHLSDIVMMQVTVDSETDCYAMINIIHSLGIPIDRYWHDYIKDPKINGYQSLHTGIIVNDKVIRFQIRTRKMQRVAQEGVLCGAFTPGGKFIQPDLPWLKADWLKIILQVKDRREKILLAKSLSQARMATVMIESPSMSHAYPNVLLPRRITPLELAFITDPQLGLHFAGALHKDTPKAADEVIEEGIGFIKIRVAGEIQYRDYFKLLKNPLARLRFIEHLRSQSESFRLRFAREILEQELDKIFLTTRDLEEADSQFYRDILQGLAQGKLSAEEAAQKIKVAAKKSANPVLVLNRMEVDLGDRPPESLVDPLRDIFPVERYGLEGTHLKMSLTMRDPIQETQFQNFTLALKRRGISILSKEEVRPPLLDDLSINPHSLYYSHDLAQRAAQALAAQGGGVLDVYLNPNMLPFLPETHRDDINRTTADYIARAGILFFGGTKEDSQALRRYLAPLLEKSLRTPPLIVIYERSGFYGCEHMVRDLAALAGFEGLGITEWGGDINFILECLLRRCGTLVSR